VLLVVSAVVAIATGAGLGATTRLERGANWFSGSSGSQD
jgi:hypothetical protein